jgi:hypothetical protein
LLDKKNLSIASFLALYKFDKLFLVQYDTYKVGIKGALSQEKKKGQLHILMRI